MLRDALSRWDKELTEGRERTRYRHKGNRKRVLKTVMGEVEYRRTVYECRREALYLSAGRSDGDKQRGLHVRAVIGAHSAGSMPDVLPGRLHEQ
ncbi:MAG: UPF0236 family protein [Oscillospiraceae bacterium]|nr:UPF0236 family protein [Oscillospiraceae bacterium]